MLLDKKSFESALDQDIKQTFIQGSSPPHKNIFGPA